MQTLVRHASVKRFHPSDQIVHFLNLICWAALAASGIALASAERASIRPERLDVSVHFIAGFALIIVIAAWLVFSPARARRFVHEILRTDRPFLAWLRNLGGYPTKLLRFLRLTKAEPSTAPQGRYNAGQRIAYALRVLLNLTPIFSSGYYYNNSVIYNSPRVNGFHVAAMYSNGRDDDSVSRGKSDQFGALALTYIGESFKFAVLPTYIDSDSLKTATVTPNDEYGIALLGSYWPEPTMGLHFGYQFVRDGRALGGSYFNYFTPAAAGGPGIAKSERGVDTHALSLGFSKRFGAQKISIVLMGNKVEYKGDSAVDGDREGWRVIPATIYRYYLSKRTHFWAAASTSQSGGLYKKAREFEKDPTKAWDVGAGLVHHF